MENLYNTERWLSVDNLDGEVWKDVIGYEGLYSVSNYGRIKSMERYVPKSNGKNMLVRERICKVWINRKYIYITLSKNGKQPNVKVHRLVAEAFLPNPNNLPQINHKDENPSNNSVFFNTDGTIDYEKTNLEWCTERYNLYYGTRIERVAAIKRKNGKPIIRLNLDGSVSKRYECGIDVQKDGFSRRAVYRCCKNTKATHHSYRWTFG